jgi:hypothetical protein
VLDRKGHMWYNIIVRERVSYFFDGWVASRKGVDMRITMSLNEASEKMHTMHMFKEKIGYNPKYDYFEILPDWLDDGIGAVVNVLDALSRGLLTDEEAEDEGYDTAAEELEKIEELEDGLNECKVPNTIWSIIWEAEDIAHEREEASKVA